MQPYRGVCFSNYPCHVIYHSQAEWGLWRRSVQCGIKLGFHFELIYQFSGSVHGD